MEIMWSRKFGPFKPVTAIKAIKLLRRNGCRSVRPSAGGFIEASIPMRKFSALQEKLAKLG